MSQKESIRDAGTRSLKGEGYAKAWSRGSFIKLDFRKSLKKGKITQLY